MALLAVLTAVLSIGLAATRPGVASAVAAACKDQPKGSSEIQQEPWQQTWFDAPAKIWPFSTGAGVTVAVLDTGVTTSNQQLPTATVLPGRDVVRNVDQGNVDCVPHGTAEAGIIAAAQKPGIGFYGLAPETKILPVRVAKEAVTNDQSKPLDPTKLAAGITYAADHGANVIDCAVVTYQDNPAVKSAVKHAISKGVVVVAMVGDSHQMQRDGIGPTTPSLTPYPASYPDVIGVGAVDSNGRRADTSQIGSYTDLVAPGSQVESDAIGGQNMYDGTGVASAFVAATAALLLSEHGSPFDGLSGAARVRALSKQLLGTASPELSTEDSMAYGAGLVDPFRALTEKPSGRGPVALPAHTAPPPPPPNPVKQAALKSRRHTNHRAAQLAEAIGGGTILLLGLVLVVPRGRVRRWRPVRREVPPARMDDAPEFVSGEKLFTHPSPRK